MAGSQISGRQTSWSQHSSSDQPLRSVLLNAFCSAPQTWLSEAASQLF